MVSGPSGIFSIGEYQFDQDGFCRLLQYVDRGGYPKWKDGTRPSYVVAMMDAAKVCDLG